MLIDSNEQGKTSPLHCSVPHTLRLDTGGQDRRVPRCSPMLFSVPAAAAQRSTGPHNVSSPSPLRLPCSSWLTSGCMAVTERPALGVRVGFCSSRGSVQQELLLLALLLQLLQQLLPPCVAAFRRLERQHGAGHPHAAGTCCEIPGRRIRNPGHGAAGGRAGWGLVVPAAALLFSASPRCWIRDHVRTLLLVTGGANAELRKRIWKD